jgi:hypothetical protein
MVRRSRQSEVGFMLSPFLESGGRFARFDREGATRCPHPVREPIIGTTIEVDAQRRAGYEPLERRFQAVV